MGWIDHLRRWASGIVEGYPASFTLRGVAYRASIRPRDLSRLQERAVVVEREDGRSIILNRRDAGRSVVVAWGRGGARRFLASVRADNVAL